MTEADFSSAGAGSVHERILQPWRARGAGLYDEEQRFELHRHAEVERVGGMTRGHRWRGRKAAAARDVRGQYQQRVSVRCSAW